MSGFLTKFNTDMDEASGKTEEHDRRLFEVQSKIQEVVAPKLAEEALGAALFTHPI